MFWNRFWNWLLDLARRWSQRARWLARESWVKPLFVIVIDLLISFISFYTGKTIVAKRKIAKGDVISYEDVVVKVNLSFVFPHWVFYWETQLSSILSGCGAPRNWSFVRRPLCRKSCREGHRGRSKHQLMAAHSTSAPSCASDRWGVISFERHRWKPNIEFGFFCETLIEDQRCDSFWCELCSWRDGQERQEESLRTRKRI